MTAYRTEASADTVVCGGCGEHVLRAETTFTAEGTLACRRCDATSMIGAAAPKPDAPPRVEHRSWRDFVLGALLPVPLYLLIWAIALRGLSMAGRSDAPLGAIAGAALGWPVVILALVVTARLRFGRVSFANGLLVSAIVSLALGGVFAVLAMGAMAGAIRG